MINDKQLRYVKSDNGFDYYIFTPTMFRQYYNKYENWTVHRSSISHKLHMFLYYILGGYNILYMFDNDNIAAYIVFTRCGKYVIKNTTRKDIFTIFVTTHPDYRKRGFATKIVYEMLHGIDLEYEVSYKTIVDDNVGSRNAALKNGYTELYPAKKCGLFKTISESDGGDWRLYIYK